ncbi:conserved hypothetical protein [Plasmopara halstedii]|uniref:RING-type domain-containing protein n=1 Tax=Plasmopara halstedii TaxID=4781 RepID=A0A0N7L877_PLAHL|nr:conserved hypothetical protein [Plasmopara halstedii]CEG49107.1 conserved hypothetical protein [Plasmopara halstedii]|eukprot:XP_024585476.1 conserved hypothetical protein [Plasmopara halstedii]
MDGMQQQRVLADGWGQQSSGSVFCADSSLRYIYESHALASQQSSYNTSNKASSHVYNSKNHHSNDMIIAGKRPRDYSTDDQRSYEGIDLFEAEIARACNSIRKQGADLPHSYGECSVCLSTNAYAQISSCGHIFHPNCFLRWFRLNRSCPLCRGAVDKVQLAQTITVQDDLEAMIAELDDEPLHLVSQQLPRLESELDDPLLTNSDQLMSFFESDLNADMNLVAFDELSSNDIPTEFELACKQQTDGDEAMEVELDDRVDTRDNQEVERYVVQQYPPASTVPNYWNVLNQGIAPSIMPPAPAVPPFVPNHQKMVHIAPKPEIRTVHQQTRSTTFNTTEKPFQSSVARFSQQTPIHQHVTRSVSCRCTGGCRNGRCACVKEGGMCGTSCRCTSCKNPFLMVKATGADMTALFEDHCFMHNVSKTRDMVQRLQETVSVPCCETMMKVVDCVHGFKCKPCNRDYKFSWCLSKLLDSERTPRNHCAICRRCCDHRDVHCNDCGRCYFAGVTASLPCPCREASSHKKRREIALVDKTEEAEDEADGDCCIM